MYYKLLTNNKTVFFFLAAALIGFVFLWFLFLSRSGNRLTAGLFSQNFEVESSKAGSQNSMIGNPAPPPSVALGGQEIVFEHTDENDGESLIIRSDKSTYSDFNNSEFFFSVVNTTEFKQSAILLFHIGQPESSIDSNPAPARITKLDLFEENRWIIQSLIKKNISINQTKLSEGLKKRKPIPENFYPESGTQIALEPGSTAYFRSRIDYSPGSKGEFWVEVIGDQGGYGLLDPWYSSSWSYRKRLTVNHEKVEGTSDLSNFPVLVNLTDLNLRHTSFNSSSTDTGLKSPSATGEDYNQWVSPTNAYTSNNSRTTGDNNDQQDYYNFSFSVPGGATINGIESKLEARDDGGFGTCAILSEISWDGGASYTSTGNTTGDMTSSDATYTMGGSANTWGRTWSASELSDTNFRYRVTASVPVCQAQLDHLQVRVYYSTSDASSEVAGHVASGSGADILFTSSDGTTKLDHEIERYASSSGELVAWVEVPTLKATQDTILYMYFGGPTNADQQNIEGTWNTNFRMVQHLEENPGTAGSGGITDSTSYNNDGTDNGGMSSADQVTGKIGKAIGVNGSTEYIQIPDGASNYLDFGTSSFTYSVWVNPTANVTAFDTVLYKGGGSVGDSGYDIYLGSGTWSNGLADSDETVITDFSGSPINNTWSFLTVVVDRSSNLVRGYINGREFDLDSITTLGTLSNAKDLYLGSQEGSSNWYQGYIDEARVYNGLLDNNWILTEYNNQNNPGTFVNLGGVEASIRSEASVKVKGGTTIRGGVEFR